MISLLLFFNFLGLCGSDAAVKTREEVEARFGALQEDPLLLLLDHFGVTANDAALPEGDTLDQAKIRDYLPLLANIQIKRAVLLQDLENKPTAWKWFLIDAIEDYLVKHPGSQAGFRKWVEIYGPNLREQSPECQSAFGFLALHGLGVPKNQEVVEQIANEHPSPIREKLRYLRFRASIQALIEKAKSNQKLDDAEKAHIKALQEHFFADTEEAFSFKVVDVPDALFVARSQPGVEDADTPQKRLQRKAKVDALIEAKGLRQAPQEAHLGMKMKWFLAGPQSLKQIQKKRKELKLRGTASSAVAGEFSVESQLSYLKVLSELIEWYPELAEADEQALVSMREDLRVRGSNIKDEDIGKFALTRFIERILTGFEDDASFGYGCPGTLEDPFESGLKLHHIMALAYRATSDKRAGRTQIDLDRVRNQWVKLVSKIQQTDDGQATLKNYFVSHAEEASLPFLTAGALKALEVRQDLPACGGDVFFLPLFALPQGLTGTKLVTPSR